MPQVKHRRNKYGGFLFVLSIILLLSQTRTFVRSKQQQGFWSIEVIVQVVSSANQGDLEYEAVQGVVQETIGKHAFHTSSFLIY
jgi:hypothetical protein